ncbi:MAG: PKD domain-containing protein, partial [Dehalococcoidales bacterium]
SASAYKWDFGDGTIAKIPYTNEVSHLFIKPGSYVVSVDVLDSEVMGVNILASTFLPVEVVESANFLNELHSMDKFDLDYSIHHDYTDLTTGIFIWDWDSYGEVIWDDTHFSMEWAQDRHSEHMIGRVSEDGTTIEHLIIRHEFVDNDRAQTNQWFELVIHDLPLLIDEAPEKFTANKRGEELRDFIIYFNTYKTEAYHWTEDAYLNVRFEKE